MAENENGAAQPAQPQQTPQMNMKILTQFVRDLSFENVLAQRGTGGEVQPDVTVGVKLEPKKRPGENQFEVASHITISSKNQGTEDVLFMIELEYVGVFQIEGVPEDQLHPFLMIECPRMMFPFIRRIISDVTRDGGFPPLNLDNIDFVTLYRNEIVRRQQETAAAAAEGSAPN